MKILLLINSLYTGGAEFSTLSFYGWLNEHSDDDIKIVCLKKTSPEFDIKSFGIRGNQITYLNSSSFYNRFKELNNCLKGFRPDIVHSVLWESNILGRFLKFFRRDFRHIESLVNNTYSSFRLQDPNITKPKLEVYRFLDAFTEKLGVDHYQANGESVALHYRKKVFIKKSKITVIPRGRKSNLFLNDDFVKTKLKRSLGIKNELVLINVGRHEFQKAQDILIRALKELGKEDEVVLLLIGRKGNFSPQIFRLIEENQLENQVKVLGHRTDVNELLAIGDIFVFPSRFEGLPGALIEAEAAGLPIICSSIPNNLEVVEENKNALVFDVNNVSMLKSNLLTLLESQDKREQMGEMSKRIFFERFEVENSHQNMYSLFKKYNSN